MQKEGWTQIKPKSVDFQCCTSPANPWLALEDGDIASGISQEQRSGEAAGPGADDDDIAVHVLDNFLPVVAYRGFVRASAPTRSPRHRRFLKWVLRGAIPGPGKGYGYG